MAHTSYKQWNEDRGVDVRLVEWNEFFAPFLNRFISLELRETKVQEFINLNQGSMSVKE